MSKTIAKALGHGNSKTTKATRLGARAAEGQANTWRTFGTAYVKADGSGYVEVKRDGAVLLRSEFGPETEGQADRFPKISSVKVVWEEDESPDLSYLGEYSDKWAEGAIERKDAGPREFRYFMPAMTSEETGNPDSPQEDMRRLEAYGQTWSMMGCYAEAEVIYPSGQGAFRIERMQSGGLWGIESDSDRDHLESVAREELANLKEHLQQFSINLADFDKLAEAAKLR